MTGRVCIRLPIVELCRRRQGIPPGEDHNIAVLRQRVGLPLNAGAAHLRKVPRLARELALAVFRLMATNNTPE